MKLTKDMKSAIVKALVEKAVPQYLEQEEKDILASFIYNRYKALAPEGWRNFPEYMRLADVIRLRRSAYNDITMKMPEKIPVSINCCYNRGVYDLLVTENDLTIEERHAMDKLQDVLNDQYQSKKLFSSIVEASNTDKQLLDMLPEAASVLAEFDFGQSKRALVPVEQIDKARRVLANGSV